MNVEDLNLVNNSGNTINSATDESLLLLRRMIKMLESKTVVDSNMRQRIIIDGNISVNGTYVINNTGTNFPINSAPSTSSTVSYVATWNGPIDPRWTNVEQARITYNTNIRNKLKFT